MEDIEFSPELCSFIQTGFPAVDAVELILLLRSRSSEWLTVAEAAGRMGPGVSHTQLEQYLHVFAAKALVVERDGRWHYLSDNASASLVERLALAYAQRPVTLVRIIYALRDSSIQSFADAFKLRKR